jgi:surface protein
MGVGIFHLPQMQTSTNEWQRPADWLPMTTNITSADQIFVGLHAVIENSDNYCAFSFTTSVGQYQVDWGDGNVTLHNSGAIAQYQYNYASVSNNTISSRGYKQVIIKVTPVSGNLLECNFQQRFVTTPVQNQVYSSGFLECILSMPNASSGQSIIFGGYNIRHNYCEKVDIKTIGNATNMSSMFVSCYSLQSVPLFNTINVTNMYGMFVSCYSLQSVPLFNTINVTNMECMFERCISLQSVPLFNTINVTNMSGMFYNCSSLQSVPLFNTSNVTNMSFMFTSCSSLQSVPLFNTGNVTNMSYMFFVCSSLQSVPLFNTINVANMAFMFLSCSSLQSVPLFNTANVTNMSNMFQNCVSLNFIPAFITTAVISDFTDFANDCNSLNRILMSFNRTVALQNCQLSKDALVEIFTNLTNRTGKEAPTAAIASFPM